MNIITEATAIEGVPIKEVMIDAICGADLPTAHVSDWALLTGLANYSGNKRNETLALDWNRTMLGMLELDALFAVYGRVKRK